MIATEEYINLKIENKFDSFLLFSAQTKKCNEYESININFSRIKNKFYIVEDFKEFELVAVNNNIVIYLGDNAIVFYYKSIYHFKYDELIEISFDIEHNLSGKKINVFKFENKYGLKKEIIICPVENIRTDKVGSEYDCYELSIDCKKINNLIDNKRKEYIKNSILYSL